MHLVLTSPCDIATRWDEGGDVAVSHGWHGGRDAGVGGAGGGGSGGGGAGSGGGGGGSGGDSFHYDCYCHWPLFFKASDIRKNFLSQSQNTLQQSKKGLEVIPPPLAEIRKLLNLPPLLSILP